MSAAQPEPLTPDRPAKYFAKPNQHVIHGPALFAAVAVHDKRVALYARATAAARIFEREVQLLRSLDQTGNLDAALDHVDEIKARLDVAYAQLRADVVVFVEAEYPVVFLPAPVPAVPTPLIFAKK